jgi:WD40 repeat protein
MPGNYNPPASVTFSPDGRVVAAFDSVNHITWLWSTENGQPIVILPATDYGIAFSPDGSLLATSARGGGILIWEMDALVSGAPSAGPTATAVSYASSAAPSGCALTPGLAIHTSTDARLWSAPDALNAQVTQHAAAGQALFVIGGPQMGAITGSAAGWYWEVTTVENGPSAGWVWQGRILECP